jgi:hypothetical protein
VRLARRVRDRRQVAVGVQRHGRLLTERSGDRLGIAVSVPPDRRFEPIPVRDTDQTVCAVVLERVQRCSCEGGQRLEMLALRAELVDRGSVLRRDQVAARVEPGERRLNSHLVWIAAGGVCPSRPRSMQRQPRQRRSETE